MEIKEKVFADGQKWFKGNLHAHTTNSDGKLTPKQAVLTYRQHGYQFMCLSEHDYFTDMRSEFDSEDFILLPGLESSVNLLDSTASGIDVNEFTCGKGYVEMTQAQLQQWRKAHTYHLLKTHHIHGILGNKAMVETAGDNVLKDKELTPVRIYFDNWDGPAAAQHCSDWLKSRGCFTTYNHPIWSRIEQEDIKGIDGFWAMEVYNYATVNECGEGEDTAFYDYMLKKGNYLNAFASDDNHNQGIYPDSFGGYVMVQAEKLCHEDIVNSLLEGRYYSSNGAEITQWGVKNGNVYVACPNGKRINFIFGGIVGLSQTVMTVTGIPLTYVECPIKGPEKYVRIEVIDMNDKKAWTNTLVLK